MFNTEANSWPPGPDGDPTKHTYSGYGCRPEVELPDEFHRLPNVTVPRLTQFKSKAIFGDLVATPDRIALRHKDGVNVLYGDGSAHWVDRSTFDPDLQSCTAISPAANPFQDNIWSIFDAQ